MARIIMCIVLIAVVASALAYPAEEKKETLQTANSFGLGYGGLGYGGFGLGGLGYGGLGYGGFGLGHGLGGLGGFGLGLYGR